MFKSNITENIKNKIGKNLHNKKGHPIKIIKDHIYNYFNNLPNHKFKTFDDFSPIVSVKYNFDLLNIPQNHSSRKMTDTYYIDEKHVLRTHTTAHQYELLEKNYNSFLITGDVYRKDEIDNKHYPVFHQLEGAYLIDKNSEISPIEDLKNILSGLIKYLFPECEYRFNNDYFPFTDPSFEIEVKFQDKWMEVLGCGVIHENILSSLSLNDKYSGWAFGLGLERLAMILFDIHDIRLFWTDDERFTKQFEEEKIIKFKPYPILKSIPKDISFWINHNEIFIKNNNIMNDFLWNNINDFYELVRDEFNDYVEQVELIDKFYHPKHAKFSMMFRIYIIPNNESINDLINPAELNVIANNLMLKFADKLKKLGYDVR